MRPWLITPVPNPAPGSIEERFNTMHAGIRNSIERCNGVLKNRFRCLLKHRVLHYTPQIASYIINACVVLHNMCIDNRIELLEGEEDADNLNMHQFNDANFVQERLQDLEAGRALRNHLILNYVQ